VKQFELSVLNLNIMVRNCHDIEENAVPVEDMMLLKK
jgi:hypothetical protein